MFGVSSVTEVSRWHFSCRGALSGSLLVVFEYPVKGKKIQIKFHKREDMFSTLFSPVSTLHFVSRTCPVHFLSAGLTFFSSSVHRVYCM